MSAIVNKYRVYCTTDSKYEFSWSETEPTGCPVDTGHSIDSAKTTIIETVGTNEVQIQEETTKTGGSYQARTFAEDIPSGAQWHELTPISWPIPVSLLSAETFCRADSDLDCIEVSIGDETIIGSITADVAATDDEITVSQSVIDNAQVGKWIHLDDGTNKDDLGRILAIDSVAKVLTMETAATNAFAAATPTYVKITTKMSLNTELTASHRMVFGESKIGGSYLPANVNVHVRYFNKDGATGKRLAVHFEYLY